MRFLYSGCVLNTGKDCFQRWVKKCTVSCSHTNRSVWQTWFSEVLPSVPARGGHLHRKISPFPSVSRVANTHPDLLLFFSYLVPSFAACVFLPIPSPCVFVLFNSGISSKEINLFLFYLSVLLFLSHPFLHVFSLNLSLSYTFLHNDAATLCPSYPPFPLRTLLSSFSFPPSLLCSHSPRS